MFSKQKVQNYLVVFLLLFAGGCGILGEKEALESAPPLNVKLGCLNDFGVRIERYLDGVEDRTEWKEAWDCVGTSIRLFKKFVGGSSDQGYTKDDVRDLLANFLVTNQPISNELVAAGFELKASFIGGSPELIRHSEVDSFMSLLEVAKHETLEIMPLIKAFKGDNSQKNLLALRDGIEKLGNRLADQTATFSGSYFFKKETLEVLLSELDRMSDVWSVPDRFIEYSPIAKSILIGGDFSGIEGGHWVRFLRLGGSIGGDIFALVTADPVNFLESNEYLEFVLKISEHLRGTLKQSIRWNDGVVPYDKIDRLLVALPEEWQFVTPQVASRSLRPLVKKILHATSQDGIDSIALDEAYNLVRLWVRGKTHLENIFRNLSGQSRAPRADFPSVFPSDFVHAAKEYKKEVKWEERGIVNRLIYIAQKYPPSFEQNEREISWSNLKRLSFTHMDVFHLAYLTVDTLIGIYGSDPDNKRGTLEDLKSLFNDFRELLYELKILDPTTPPEKQEPERFVELNFFTKHADGNDWANIDELVHYFAMLLSISDLSERIHEFMEKESGCPILKVNPDDPDSQLGVEAWCYRRNLFENFRKFWAFMPGLLDFYDQLGATQKWELIHAIEYRGRGGFSDQPFTNFDSQNMAAVPTYVEALLARFDTDRNGVIGKSETLRAYSSAFTEFIGKIACRDPRKNPRIVEAVFAYAVKFEKPPADTTAGSLDLIAFMLRKSSWKIRANRLSLHRLFAELARPIYGTRECKKK